MNKSMLLVSSLTLVIGIGAGYFMFGSEHSSNIVSEVDSQPLFYRSPMNPEVTSPIPAKDSMGMDYIPVFENEKETSSKKEILFYRNAMNPAVTSPVQTKDSMGMDYVPVYADSETSKVVGTVKIDPVVVQNIGVRTAIAEKTSLSRTIRAVGRVDFDEERMSHLHPKIEGWIEEIRVDKTGQVVAKDDVLLSIYSPKLVATQQEYLLALNNALTLSKSPFDEIRLGAEELVKSTRERLQLFDVPEHQIIELEKNRTIKKNLHIHSSVDGTAIRIGARKGEFVTPKTELYMMVDLNQIWVYADIYEYELPWVKIGDNAQMTLASVPGRTFTGTLSYIYPYAQSKTRTTRVRLVFDNKELLLRPDMFAEINIKADTVENVVVIPSEAVIRSGDRTQVFIVRSRGEFEPKIVSLGIESGGKVVVLSGVNAGEEVVTSAQFLVDSESKLREATAKMMEVLKAKGSDDAPMSGEADNKAQGTHNDD